MKYFKSVLAISLISATLLTACKKKNDDNLTTLLLAGILLNTVKVSTAAELTTESADNYDENNYGLVTSVKLSSWIDNWSANKPADISGNLVIVLYFPSGSYTKQYLVPTNGVKVYDWTSSVFNQSDRFAYRASRDNGIITDPNTLPTGAITDEILQTYGIDPTKDLIIFVAGSDRGAGTLASPKGSVYQNIGRAVYWLRYWGIDRKNVAILNGAIDANGDFASSYLSTDSGVLSSPTKGTFSVKNAYSKIDNTVLVQPLENVINIAKNPTSHGIYGVNSVFLADARHNTTTTDAEYTGGTVALTLGPSSAALFAGHIKGAKFTPWPQVIDQTTGKFKSKAVLASLWSDVSGFNSVNAAGTGYQSGQTILHYCRTNARSMVTGMSTFLILGKPSIFYENSMIEWTALSAYHTNTALRTLPAGHKFATDTAEVTESGTSTPGPAYNGSAAIAQYSAFNINTSATTTRKNIDEDKAYKGQ